MCLVLFIVCCCSEASICLIVAVWLPVFVSFCSMLSLHKSVKDNVTYGANFIYLLHVVMILKIISLIYMTMF